MRVGVLALLLAACAGDPDNGPLEVEWGHAACQRCNMILDDAFHAAQVRHHPADGQTKAYVFDDIGCALIWLDGQPWKDDPATEIWVSDYKTGGWIDARKAHYVTGQQTPMLYGLGAQVEPVAGGMTLEGARQHVLAVEKRLNLHQAH